MKKLIILILSMFFNQFGAWTQTGENIFDDSYVHEIHLDFHDADFLGTMYDLYNIAHSQGDNPDYIAAAITIDGEEVTTLGNTLDTIGIRMKGDFSFILTPNDKKPFKIDINKFVSGQKYDGLKKFNLAPAAGDPSFLREKIAYELHQYLGVKAPRCAYAKIYLNGEYWGLYQIIEQVDKSFLEDRFGNKDGNLFKSKGGATLKWVDDNQSTYEDEAYPKYELKTNKTENDWSDFIAFMKLLDNTPDSEFKESLETHFNVSGFLKDLAVQNYIMNNDNYFHGGNNYYLYHNTQTQKWEWIPWDLNYSMTNYSGFGLTDVSPQTVPMIESSMLGDFVPLTSRILENDEFKLQYYNEVCQLVIGLGATSSIHARIDGLADMIRNDVYLDDKKKYTNQDFEDNVAYGGVDELYIGNLYGMKDFTEKRVNKLTAELADLGVSNCMNTTSIENSIGEEISLSLYPNPVSRNFTITGNGLEEADIHSIKILNLLGKEVLNIEDRSLSNSVTINTKQLNPGAYMLTVYTQTGMTCTKQFIKQ